MKRVVAVLAVAGVVAVIAAAAPRGEKAGVLAPLEKGQRVALKETPGGYTITLMPGLDLGSRVVEVGADYVVLLDPAGVTETRVPIYSVKAVVVTRPPGK